MFSFENSENTELCIPILSWMLVRQMMGGGLGLVNKKNVFKLPKYQNDAGILCIFSPSDAPAPRPRGEGLVK